MGVWLGVEKTTAGKSFALDVHAPAIFRHHGADARRDVVLLFCELSGLVVATNPHAMTIRVDPFEKAELGADACEISMFVHDFVNRAQL